MSGSIDLNCDLGEGAGQDAALMPWITSANIACGAHAGDRATMEETVGLARRHGVSIGAHPGFADREHFGRREWILPSEEIHALVTSQVRALQELTAVRHVKPHGALYTLAARDARVATAIAAAVRAIDPRLILFALAGSQLVRAGEAAGLRVASEVFGDRGYQSDGQLVPRGAAEALIHDEARAVAQVTSLVVRGQVQAVSGELVSVRADTVCLHGDGAQAVPFAQRLRRALEAAELRVAPVFST